MSCLIFLLSLPADEALGIADVAIGTAATAVVASLDALPRVQGRLPSLFPRQFPRTNSRTTRERQGENHVHTAGSS